MRTQTETIQIFKLSELSEEAQNKALEKWNEHNEFDSDFIMEDYETILNILGFSDVKIYYSGFYSQGDGACFTGRYQYSKEWAKQLKAHCDYKDVIIIGGRLQALQARYFYRLHCDIEHRGRYYHENSVYLDVSLSNDADINDYDAVESELLNIIQDIIRIIYKALESNYDYQTSMECFKDTCDSNEYEFLSNGEMI